MDKDLERRLSRYEPLWDEWYADSLMWEDSMGAMFLFRDGSGRKSCVRVLTVDSRKSGRPLAQMTAAAIARLNARIPLAGQAFLVSVRNFTVKNHENIGGAPVAADILVQTDEYDTLLELTMHEQLPYVTARKLADNICRGIRTAHKAGFTFGDICPENIRTDSEGHFCLDAPCTFDPDNFDRTYAAPETLTGSYDRYKADIYSYGLVLYQIFNGGLLPLQRAGRSAEDAVNERLAGAPFDPPAGAPPELQRFIMRCCMAHPETRYESMDEVYRVLSQLTVDHVPPEYERCYTVPLTAVKTNTSQKRKAEKPRREEHHTQPRREVHHAPAENPQHGNEPKHGGENAPPKESKGMRMYVMVLLYMLLFAGAGFLLYSAFFLK